MRSFKLKKVLLPFLFLCLIFSFLVNLLLYTQLRKYYTLLYAVELDPLGLSYFQENTVSSEKDRFLQTVVFYGDSRAAQWPSPAVEGFQFINRGIGNQTTAQVAGRFDEQIMPIKPDVVVLQLCINDLKTIPLFPGRRQQIISDCESNLQEIVERSLDLRSIVVISTIFPLGKVPLERRLVWSGEIEQSRQEVNQFIRNLSSDRVIVLDAETLLADDKGKIKQEYSFDTLHLNEAGYQALNLELTRILASIKQKQQ
jgi:lysophospholipase L1-like esterase